MPAHYAKPGEGEERCPHCNGLGLVSKYDLGWNSLMHDPSLAALHDCTCNNGLYKVADGPPPRPVIF